MPSITETVSTPGIEILDNAVRVDVLDPEWNLVPYLSADYLTREDAEAYVTMQYNAALATKAFVAHVLPDFVMPVFTIDGEQFVPAVNS